MPKPSIHPRPHWELPSKERLAKASLSPRLLKHFEANHGGLRELKLAAIQKTKGGSVRKGTVQRLELRYPQQDPPWSSEHMCRLAWLAGERYVRRNRVTCQFRLYFVGCSEDVGEFTEEATFTIKLDQVLEDPGDDEGVDEDPEDEDPEDEDPEDGEEGDGRGDGDLPDALVPVGQRLEPAGIQPPHMQLNPQFVVSLQNNALGLAQRAYEGSMSSNRLLVQEMRAEMSAMVGDIKAMADQNNRAHLDMLREMKNFFVSQAEQSNFRVQGLERQLTEVTKLNAKQYENLQQLAQQGWHAFQDAMRMKSDVVDERVAWAQWLQEKHASTPPTEPQGNGTGASGLVAKGAPLVLAGLSIMMRKRGDEANAAFLEDLAKRFAGPMAQPDDDEGEFDDEDVHDVSAQEPGSTPPNGRSEPFVGNPSTAAQDAPTPFADRCRAFRAKLAPAKIAAMQGILPKPCWRAFESACSAHVDSVAISGMQTMYGFIHKDMTLQLNLAQHLSEDEVLEILSVAEDVQKIPPVRPRRAPTRPRPDTT